MEYNLCNISFIELLLMNDQCSFLFHPLNIKHPFFVVKKNVENPTKPWFQRICLIWTGEGIYWDIKQYYLDDL